MTQQHHAVIHPADFLATEKRALGRVSDWAATHLAAFFGLVWTVWFFIIWPLLALLLPKGMQNIAFFISSGWIQLWALPLLNYVGNKTQQMQAAQSEVQHQALTHIAHVEDAVHALTVEIHEHVTDGLRTHVEAALSDHTDQIANHLGAELRRHHDQLKEHITASKESGDG